MIPHRVHQYQQRLAHLLTAAEQITDLEQKSHFAKYICVIAAGFLEVAYEEVMTEYVRKRTGSSEIVNFVQKMVDKNQSINFKRLQAGLSQFDPGLAIKLEAVVTQEEKDAINSIKANRDQIAHGDNVGITYVTVKGYVKDCGTLVGKLSQVVLA